MVCYVLYVDICVYACVTVAYDYKYALESKKIILVSPSP